MPPARPLVLSSGCFHPLFSSRSIAPDLHSWPASRGKAQVPQQLCVGKLAVILQHVGNPAAVQPNSMPQLGFAPGVIVDS